MQAFYDNMVKLNFRDIQKRYNRPVLFYRPNQLGSSDIIKSKSTLITTKFTAINLTTTSTLLIEQKSNSQAPSSLSTKTDDNVEEDSWGFSDYLAYFFGFKRPNKN